MEDTNKKSSGVGLDVTPWPKSSIEAMPPSADLPLGTSTSSFQVWKRPFLHGDNGSGSSSSRTTKIYFRPLDQPNSQPASTGGGVNKKTQNPSPNSSEDGESNSIKAETVSNVRPKWCRNIDPDEDPKKLKRIMSNRLSAQKSRTKKLQYVTEMERKVKALEAQISVLSPQVALYKNHQRFLQLEQKSLSQQMSAYTNNKILRDAEIEEKKAEVSRLRRLHLSQQQQMQAQKRMLSWETGNPNMMGYLNSNQAQISRENPPQVHRPSQLNLTQQEAQQKQGQAWMPSWELALGQMVNPSLNQSGPSTQQKATNINSNQGGIDKMQSYNSSNPADTAPNCFV
ncbi:bZIP transcription factor 18-like [Corylus avellana]|uniref:bZIP transcription factor 18-like n=1 Tax=Corylus avellana TaxID=13451 RepID=UPI00286D5350|nr:bZIP transcription factor 18-like [Corylus avellana]